VSGATPYYGDAAIFSLRSVARTDNLTGPAPPKPYRNACSAQDNSELNDRFAAVGAVF